MITFLTALVHFDTYAMTALAAVFVLVALAVLNWAAERR